MEPSEAFAYIAGAMEKAAQAQLEWMNEATKQIERLHQRVDALETTLHDRTDHLA